MRRPSGKTVYQETANRTMTRGMNEQKESIEANLQKKQKQKYQKIEQ